MRVECKIILRLKIFIAILPLLVGCIGIERRTVSRIGEVRGEPEVRVLIGDKGGVIGADGTMYIHKGTKVFRVSSGEIELKQGGIHRGDEKLLDANPSVRLSFEDERFRFNGKAYRGEVIFKKTLVINKVPLESYLYSVVGCEFNCGEIEAMRAGACAARSYALYHLKADNDYDLVSSDQDQVYKGAGSETENSRAACDYTRGVVCVYRGRLINAMYSSACGGKTANAKDVVGKDIPYLKSRPCSYCEISPSYSWTKKYSSQNFHEFVGERLRMLKGKDPGRIKYVNIKKRDSSGRVKELAVGTDKGNILLYGEDVRSLLDLKSRYFDIRKRGDWVYIEGKGWGHGVGMCAWGAIGMAKKGKSFKEILRYYYRGISIKKLY